MTEMTPQVTVCNDADQIALGILHARTSEPLSGHLYDGLGHRTVKCYQGHFAAAMHDVHCSDQTPTKLSAGMQQPESSRENPRRSSSATAIASPSASITVVEVVGASSTGRPLRFPGSRSKYRRSWRAYCQPVRRPRPVRSS